MKACLIQSNPVMGDIQTNFNWIKKQIISNDADIYVAPELALIGYPPDDLLFDKEFIKKQELAFSDFQPFLKNKLLIIGGVLLKKNKVFNSAFIISHNNIKHQHKQCLPNYGVFDEKRYFSAGDNQKIISYKSKKILILICEDFWDKDLEKKYQDKKIDFCIVINASPFEINKLNVRINRAKKINKKIKSNLIYLNMVGGQDDVVFDGASFLLNKNNNISCQLITLNVRQS